jgi:hypothetical protein
VHLAFEDLLIACSSWLAILILRLRLFLVRQALEFPDSWRDYRSAIGLVRILRKIILMIIFGRVEIFKRDNFRDDWMRPTRVFFGSKLVKWDRLERSRVHTITQTDWLGTAIEIFL